MKYLLVPFVVSLSVASLAAQFPDRAEITRRQTQSKLDMPISLAYNGPVSGLVEQLGDLGANLVLDPEMLIVRTSSGTSTTVSERTITINVTQQPLRDVLGAVASALNGLWEQHGEIFALVSAATHPDAASYSRFVRMVWDGHLFGTLPPPPVPGWFPAMRDPRGSAAAGGERSFPAPYRETGIASTRVDWRVALLDRITDAQWDLMWKRGHLKMSDLSQFQRSLIPKAETSKELLLKNKGRRLVVKP